MIIANIMNLCEIEPKKVYEWFMEMFVDAYDWVMVPNVYEWACSVMVESFQLNHIFAVLIIF